MESYYIKQQRKYFEEQKKPVKRKLTFEEKIAILIFGGIGALGGIAALVYFGVVTFNGLTGPSDIGTLFNIKLTAIIAQLFSAVALMATFAYIIIFFRMKWWNSIAYGTIAGGISGGISFGLSYSLLMFLSSIVGVLYINEDHIVSDWRILGISLLFGFKNGCMIGMIVGVITGFSLSYRLGYHRKEEEIDHD